MKFPTVFVNHGGGPLPLLGRQPDLVEHMKGISAKIGPNRPRHIVVLSAHWESNPVSITSNPSPAMLYDYYGFPPETYEYKYSAPGSPDLAKRIEGLLKEKGMECQLDEKRGFDHGVFIPLMLMYPEANIPVVCISMHNSLSPETNMAIGAALEPLRHDSVLILGSGYSFHNLESFFHPSDGSLKASIDFNNWLKDTIMNSSPSSSSSSSSSERRNERLKQWESAPGARECHPREDHLMPLLMVSAAGGDEAVPQLIYDTTDGKGKDHAVTGYLFN